MVKIMIGTSISGISVVITNEDTICGILGKAYGNTNKNKRKKMEIQPR